MTRTFPSTGNAREDSIKAKAGYVEYAVFAGQKAGYFCGTCAAYRDCGGQQGFCAGLKVPIVSYGCCNYWRIAPRKNWIGADGLPL